jgi:hypothetical protein
MQSNQQAPQACSVHQQIDCRGSMDQFQNQSVLHKVQN